MRFVVFLPAAEPVCDSGPERGLFPNLQQGNPQRHDPLPDRADDGGDADRPPGERPDGTDQYQIFRTFAEGDSDTAG